MLLLWPCWWSISLAAPLGQLPDPVILIKFSIGALLMRSAGCIINDIWDRDFDRQVERTKNRPLASGELTVMDAGVTLFFTLSASFAILLSFNYNSIFLGLASMPIVIGYPLMKRYTYFPQAILGLAMNWGALLGWNEVIGTCSLVPVLPLYLGGVFWTLVYDTIYGYQDVSDDAKLGKTFVRLLITNYNIKHNYIYTINTSFIIIIIIIKYTLFSYNIYFFCFLCKV
jgi:4-hydroxybenzoate polyprenyltransferase